MNFKAIHQQQKHSFRAQQYYYYKASLASHSCTFGNTFRQGAVLPAVGRVVKRQVEIKFNQHSMIL